MQTSKLITGIALCSMMSTAAISQSKSNYAIIQPTDTEEQIVSKAANVVPTARQLRWQQLELTAFFHFGVNTFTGREWGDGKEDPSIFNPTELDAKQWVRTCKDAGIKQVIITAKHHDGFCLWPSKYTDHSVKSSPWKGGKGDVVKEVSDACKQQGIGFGVYLSPWDRNNPKYGTEEYNTYFVNQLTELLTNYGRVDEVWFDGANGEGPNGKKQVYDFDRWYNLIRKLQPQAVIAIMGPDVRWVGTESGYGRETEWSVVPANNLDQSAISAGSQKDLAFKPSGDMTGDDIGGRDKISKAKGLVWYPAETDVSIRPGWFYHENEDGKVKSPEKLMDIYYASVGRNGVLLLNIPPNKKGLLSDSDVKNLQGWKALRDKSFGNNILKGASITIDGKQAKNIADNKYNTYWQADKNQSTATFEISLPVAKEFNLLQLQENIAVGQRVESFELEAFINNEWKTVVKGTTIGFKRIIKFDALSAQKLRFKITGARLNPTISEIGVYKEASQ